MPTPVEQITDPAVCLVRLSQGERPSELLASLLNRSIRAPSTSTACRPTRTWSCTFTDFDEYWLFTAGRPRVTLALPDGLTQDYELEPGDMIACVRGVKHTLAADHELRYFQFSSVRAGGEREGHLTAPAERPATTRAIWFAERSRAELRDEPVPAGGPGQILCRTLFSGVTNGTERNALLGGNYSAGWPCRPGYQVVGEVVDVGAGVSGYAPGDVVFSGNFLGHGGWFAADVSDPDGANTLTVKLPPAIDPAEAALFGMASVGLHDVRRAGTKIGDRVLVVGAGCIGQFTAQAARVAGAEVTICDLDAGRLALAAELGADATQVVDGDEAWAALRAAGRSTWSLRTAGRRSWTG